MKTLHRPIVPIFKGKNIEAALRELEAKPCLNTRGDWLHYACIFCDDKSSHLGINAATGAVRCLRCGFTFSLQDIKKRLKGSRVSLNSYPYLQNVTEAKGDSFLDVSVYRYMVSRGVENTSLGWRYGRGELTGCPVFPAFSIDKQIHYAQWKVIDKKGDYGYRSPTNSKPRLDFFPAFNSYNTNTLVLVEGPIDALVVRKLTRIWCSPIYGGKPTALFMFDVHKAVQRFNIKEVIVMLDREKIPMTKSRGITLRMKRLGIPATFKHCNKLDGKDPAEMTADEIINAVFK